jgi:hypothetical protein
MNDAFLTALARLAPDDQAPPAEDEHARFALYQSVRAAGGRERELLACLALDPDPVMAGSVLAELLADADAPGRTALLTFAQNGNEAFLRRRAHELSLLDRLGPATSEALVAQILDGSEWLQRRAVDRAGQVPILLALAEGGRTRRIRAAARQRARTLGAAG